MKIFEKYINKELNILETFFVKCLLAINGNIKKKIDDYLTVSHDLKYMFLIQNAEKEIISDEYLKNEDFFNDFYGELQNRSKFFVNLYE